MSATYQPDASQFRVGNGGRLASIFRFGVRQKVMLILLTVLLTALTGSGWMALQKEEQAVMAEIDRRGSDISRFVAKSLAYSVIGYDYHTVQLLLDAITSSADVDYAKVDSAKGNVMAESGNIAVPDEGGIVMFVEDIALNGDKVGKLTLGLSTRVTIKRLESQKYRLVTRECFIIMLIALGEFLALSYIIVRPVTLMSKSLNKSVDENGRFVGSLPVLSNDEFGMLAEQFNQLSMQLNDANQRLQSKVDLADQQLRKTNEQLVKQSEELKCMNEEFKRMSLTDALTGLYNRRHFEELMETGISMSLRHGDPNSLILIDVDHFKNINDTYGHSAGDIVLKEVAHVLRSQLRKTDVLCRIGGEEFVCLCKRAGGREAMELAEKLRRIVEARTIEIRGQKIRVTVSAGVATIPDRNNTKTSDDFYRCADDALYRSKENGRNRVSHYDDKENDRNRVSRYDDSVC